MADGNIDSKQKSKGRARRRQTNAEKTSENPDELMDEAETDQVLNVRVKERETETNRPKSRLGSQIRSGLEKGLTPLFSKETAASAQSTAKDFKETIKRPLTGLFRRPGSRSGNRESNQANTTIPLSLPRKIDFDDEETTKNVERAVSPEIPYNQRLMLDSMAKAPNISVNRTNAMYQIETIGLKNPELGKLDDIDISLMARYLCPEDEVTDESVPWTWDYLFASVSSEMREEWALEEAEDEVYDSINTRMSNFG